MKKIICFIILMTAALNIEASDFFGSGDPGGSCAGTKMAITFNYDHLTIDGNSTHQYLVDVYASNKDEKEFKAQFPSYDEYISYWNFTAIPKVQNLFIANFVSEETNLQKENAIRIVDEKDCQYLICIVLNKLGSDGSIDATAEIKKKTDAGYGENVASFDLKAKGGPGKGLENKAVDPIIKISKELCKEVIQFMEKN